jgi:hypothetical protein
MSNFTAVANYVKMNLCGYGLPGIVWANECMPQFFLGNKSKFGFSDYIPAGLDAISFDACECMCSNTAPYNRLVLFPAAARARRAADAPFVTARRRTGESLSGPWK